MARSGLTLRRASHVGAVRVRSGVIQLVALKLLQARSAKRKRPRKKDEAVFSGLPLQAERKGKHNGSL